MRRALFLTFLGLVACSQETGSGSTSLSTGDAGTEPTDSAAEGETTDDPSATETMPTTTSSTSEDTDSAGFLGDMPEETCGAQCNIWVEGDCPEGEKCTSVDCEGADNAWDSTVCREIGGSAANGDECMGLGGQPGLDGLDTCAEGLMCWDIDADTGLGYCIDFCTGPAETPSCDPGAQCQVWHDGTLPICVPECDPFLNGSDCPAEGNLCVPGAAGAGFVCVLDASGGAGPVGTGCDFNNTCNPGLVCAASDFVPNCNEGTWGCCTEICDINETSNCSDAMATCVAWFEAPIPPGYESVGACGLDI